jgi:hypothetical protein
MTEHTRATGRQVDQLTRLPIGDGVLTYPNLVWNFNVTAPLLEVYIRVVSNSPAV